MKLTVKDMDIATGGVLVVLLNTEDARKLDLYSEDRVTIKKGNKWTAAIVDIGESKKAVPPGHIGLFEEVLDKLNAKDKDIIEIDIQENPKSINFIKKKMDGQELNTEETNEIVKDIVEGNLTDIELAYYIAGCYIKNMSMKETVDLTRSIVAHGGHLQFNKAVIMDKHCSGGVAGNRTTMVVVPILAAAGITMPKTSSRSITSPAGTADTMEVLAPVIHTLPEIKKIVETTGACIVWGGAVDLAAADDKLIRIRHTLSIDPEGMLLASIMAKKAAVGSTHVLIDIPLGKETKIMSMKRALHLKRQFIKIGKRLGMHIKVIITDGKEPIGSGIGPNLEARDVLYLLRRDPRKPIDLEKKALKMAEIGMKIAGVTNPKKKVKEILESGAAYGKMQEIIKAQGGDPCINPDSIPIGKYEHTFYAYKKGRLVDIDNTIISKIARIAGAPQDKEAGIYLYKHEGNPVKKGEKIFTIYAKNPVKLKYAVRLLKKKDGIVIR